MAPRRLLLRLQKQYNDIVKRLDEACKNGKITGYQESTILELSGIILDAIAAKFENIRKRMKVLKSNKFKVSAAVVVLVLGVSIGGTIAWLHKSTDTVRNSFDPGLVNVTIDENFEPGDVRNKTVVKQVRIKNSRQDSKGNGNLNVVPAYIRVQLVPTWVKDADNETTGKKEQVVLPVDAASLIDYHRCEAE